MPQDTVEIVPTLLNYKQLREMGINYSRAHLHRLEAKDRLPRRIYLSPQKIAWRQDEVLAWLNMLSNERKCRVYRVYD